jgi:hypothetical protein
MEQNARIWLVFLLLTVLAAEWQPLFQRRKNDGDATPWRHTLGRAASIDRRNGDVQSLCFLMLLGQCGYAFTHDPEMFAGLDPAATGSEKILLNQKRLN